MNIALGFAEWWLLLLAIVAIGLVVTGKFACACLAAGSFSSCVLAACGMDISTQLSSFVVVVVLCIFVAGLDRQHNKDEEREEP